jgi:autotransporter-associated beta strand protein
MQHVEHEHQSAPVSGMARQVLETPRTDVPLGKTNWKYLVEILMSESPLAAQENMKSVSHNPSAPIAALTLIALMAMSFVSPADAQKLFWDGGTVNITANGDGLSEGTAGSWDNVTQNWDQGSGVSHTAWSSGGDAVFAGTAGVVTLNDVITANSVTVNTANYAFTDNGNTGNTLSVNFVTNSVNTAMSNNIVNSGTFEKDGSGTLTLLASSPSLDGAINVNAGTLIFGSVTVGLPSGPQNFGSVNVANNATFRINANTSESYGQSISGGGALYVSGNSSSSTVALSGSSTFTGNVTLNSITATIYSISDSAANPLGYGTNVTIGAGASATTLNYQGYGDTTSRTLTLGGSTANTALNSIGYGPLVWTGPAIAGSATSPRILNLGGTSSYNNVFAGAIADGAAIMALTKSGTGTWMVTASNSFSGGVTVNNGTLLITNESALGVATNWIIFTPSSGSTASGTLKSTNANVTLGAGHTINIVTNVATFGVTDTNNLYIAAYITGPGAVTKASSSYNQGTVRFSNDTNNFTGAFTASFGNTEFTSVANSSSPSALGTGITNSGAIVLANNTSSGTFRYVGANNSSTTRPLWWTATTGNYALDVTNSGVIAYLNTTSNLVNGAGVKTLTLEGSNTGTNTLAQVINDSTGGATTLVKDGVGHWVLTGANTFSGTTTIAGGMLTVSSDANLGTAPGSATPGSLIITNGALSASASFALNANRGIAIGPTSGSGNGAIDVATNKSLTYAGVIADNGGTGSLVKTDAGTLTLSGANTYSGNTTINGGTLALTGSGLIGSGPKFVISSGATFDVSVVSGGYSLAAGQTLATTNGGTATVNGSLNLASASVVITNVINTPTINVIGGALTLASGVPFTVNVNGTLTTGSYKLISKGTGGSVTGTAPAAVTVGGAGLASGATASLSISNNELYLVVSGGTLTPPVINHFGLVGGQAVLSFNGPSGQSWKILTATNVNTALANWTIASSGMFSGSVVNYTNSSPKEQKRFYAVTSP